MAYLNKLKHARNKNINNGKNRKVMKNEKIIEAENDFPGRNCREVMRSHIYLIAELQNKQRNFDRTTTG
jgi:hypothetical protein